MVRRFLLGDTLFDEELAPAYCEDQELCLRIAPKATASVMFRMLSLSII